MKISHWSLGNGSGLARVASSISEAEAKMGLESTVASSMVESEAWDATLDSDIHVIHSHLPNPIAMKLRRGSHPYRIVWVAHGTPDHAFQNSVQEAESGGAWASDSLMLMMHWLQNADARVTFWPRHQWIYQQIVDKGSTVHCVPLGVDTAYWSTPSSRGKFAGAPSLFAAENPHFIKWSYDLLTIWREVAESLDGGMAKLHDFYVVRDHHRAFIPWAYRMGSAFHAFITPSVFDQDGLRNAFQSTDYTIGLVRYGDFNHLSMQANAAGAKTISYAGNPYSDYWMTEGDQRVMAKELTAILKGDIAPREKLPVPDLADTAKAMVSIYESLFDDGSSRRILELVDALDQPSAHHGSEHHRGSDRLVRHLG